MNDSILAAHMASKLSGFGFDAGLRGSMCACCAAKESCVRAWQRAVEERDFLTRDCELPMAGLTRYR